MSLHSPNFLSPEPPIEEENTIPPKPKTWGIFFFVGFVFFLMLGAIVTHAIIDVYKNKNSNAYEMGTLEAKKPKGLFGKLKEFIFHNGGDLAGVEEDRINILIMGQGGPGHDGPYLTDTLILASFKPSTKQVAMMSIPRDLDVSIPGYGRRKINNANAFAEAKQAGTGPQLSKTVIEDTFNIKIHYFIRVDFKAFEDLVDQVGGVNIDVDQSFTDAEYPIPGREDVFPISNRYKILHFEKGIQKMDGKTALEYARSRHGNNGEGSDYARSKRQQKVLLALKEKLISFETIANPSKLNDIFNTLQAHILTDLSFSDMLSFASIGRDINTSEIATLTLDDSPNGYLRSGHDAIGSFILMPKTGDFNDINAAFANIFSTTTTVPRVENTTPIQDPSPISSSIVEIHNGTWAPGLAAQMKTRLIEKEFSIGQVGNSIKRPEAKSAIYILQPKANDTTAELLQKELGFPVLTSPPSSEFYAKNTDILVVIGEDFTQ